MRGGIAVMLVAGVAAAAIGCKGSRGLKRHQGPEYEDETASWERAVRDHGGDGMWLVSRGYHRGDDLVALATNAEFSHASVLDLGRMQVIEAVGKGVVVTDLLPFLRDTHRLRILRPHAWSPEAGDSAVRKARSVVGAGYDFLGVVGAPQEDHFYCSELAAWSLGIPVDRAGPQNVLHPRNLDRMADVLFDSGDRDGIAD